jgi:porphobilinogen synthase
MDEFVSPVSNIIATVETIKKLGICDVILFGIPEQRDRSGIQAADPNGPVQKSIRSIRSSFGKTINVITDVCVCQYNESGHCGIVTKKNGSTVEVVDNDPTLELLCKIALSHVDAGADVVAPSSMMDGQVWAIRNALRKYGSSSTKILAYSAKHSSTLYSPFRSTAFANSAKPIDKSTYQVSYTNPRQAMREIANDISEGADMVMIKPSIAYLDLVAMAKDKFDVPLAVQNVSGEYVMLKAAEAEGWIDLEECLAGMLHSFKRAGADKIISYFAVDIARRLTGQGINQISFTERKARAQT